MNIKGLWKLLLVIILVQIIYCKNYITKHNNGKHFLISTKHGKNAPSSLKLDLHKKKLLGNSKSGNRFPKQAGKQGNNLKSVETGHDYQITLPTGSITSSTIPIRSTGKCILIYVL